ncbi:MAG: hypothetical protein Q8P59_12920 [Dehalococcoidia bacterium]|nr:hypothetical protein [Dehalococcoidia bacterium]
MTSDTAQREKVYRFLRSNPEVRRLLAVALKVEEEGRASSQYYLGWQWEDIPIATPKLKILVEEGLVKLAYHSANSKNYLVKEPEIVKEALAAIGEDAPAEEGVIPANLFNQIVGHDEVKYWMGKSLKAERPTHILLIGPPATAKSMFLEDLGSLPGAQYCLGGSSSKAGIAEFLLYFQPKFLIIDELEKMDRQDFSVLLSLMSSGLVTRMKKGMRETERLHTTVYAGVNRADNLPPELLSRFIQFIFVTYTLQEFIEVSTKVITDMGKDAGLARYIAEKVALRTRDVRQAVLVGNIVESKEEVDRFEGGLRL